MNQKLFENMVVITLIGIIICLLFPIIQKMIYDAELSGAEARAYGSIDSVKLLYLKESFNKDVSLPFIVRYNKTSYKVYAGNYEYQINTKLENSGKMPTSGEIVLFSDNTIKVLNLKYDDFICNKNSNGNLNCVRSS